MTDHELPLLPPAGQQITVTTGGQVIEDVDGSPIGVLPIRTQRYTVDADRRVATAFVPSEDTDDQDDDDADDYAEDDR